MNDRLAVAWRSIAIRPRSAICSIGATSCLGIVFSSVPVANQSLSCWRYGRFDEFKLGAVVAARFGLDGSMIPRSVTRLFDQRAEPRIEPDEDHGVLEHRGRRHPVNVVNLSSSGAM